MKEIEIHGPSCLDHVQEPETFEEARAIWEAPMVDPADKRERASRHRAMQFMRRTAVDDDRAFRFVVLAALRAGLPRDFMSS